MPSLPTFRSVRFRRREKDAPVSESRNPAVLESDSDGTLTPTHYSPGTGVDVKRATRTRKRAIAVSSFCFFVSVIFLILVIIGNISNRAVIRNTFFFKLDLSQIFPQAISGDIAFTNSIARSLGLHDFYQVGMWSYCEGYNNEGITSCSRPRTLYWFDPVSIILNELLPGATVSLPTDVVKILHIVKIASSAMFTCFIIGIVFASLSVFLVPLALYSRWWSLPLAIFTFFTALMTAVAAIIATVMFTIFRNVFTSQAGLQIGAELGTQMMVFMWIATGFSIVAFGVQLGLTCCCASRRDVKTGRKSGSRHAYGERLAVVEKEKEKRTAIGIGRRRLFGRKRIAEEV